MEHGIAFVRRIEKRQALYVIPVKVRKQQMEHLIVFLCVLFTAHADAGSRIDDYMIAVFIFDFQACGVAADSAV